MPNNDIGSPTSLAMVTCDRCGNTADYPGTYPDYITHQPDRSGAFCANCCIACEECGVTATSHNSYPHYIEYRVGPGGDYCDECVTYCENCSEYYTGDECPDVSDHSYDDDDGSYRDGNGLINSYSYKPYPEFHGVGPAFLGAEIEISAPGHGFNQAARIAADGLGSLGYLKEDSSISLGFEMVTHPMTYAYAMDNFPWPMLRELHDLGCRATEETGIHVHVSRAGFASPCHVYRWMKFVYRNAREVQAIARRRSRDWAPFDASTRQQQKHYAKNDRDPYGGSVYCPRYSAINSQNAETFEVRVFASSLNEHEIKAALALVAATVEYTAHLSAHDILRNDGWTWSAFMQWLPNKYAPLRSEAARLCVS